MVAAVLVDMYISIAMSRHTRRYILGRLESSGAGREAYCGRPLVMITAMMREMPTASGVSTVITSVRNISVL